MLELLMKMESFIEEVEKYEIGNVAFNKHKVSLYDEVTQAIEDLKSISEPIGANIENVEVMDKKKKNTVWGMPVLAQFPPEED